MKIPAAAFFIISALASMIACGAEDLYSLANEIHVGGEGGWDFLSVDEEARRLYVAHATRINVIDLEKNEVIADIKDTPGVHGFAIAHALGKGFSTNGGKHTVSIVDLTSHLTLNTLLVGPEPDAILYEPSRQEVYAFSVGGQSVTVIGAASERIVATIPLSGRPEFAACDPEAGRVYCNLTNTNEVAVIDTQTHALVNRWPTAPGEKPYGMAIDLEHHRLFIGCRNNLLLMLDSTSGRIVRSVPIGNNVDANAYDPVTRLVFASCGDGTVTIAKVETPEKLVVVQTLKTAPEAATMALDLKTHKIYLPTARLEPVPEDPQRSLRRPPGIVPNTFRILVYKMAGAGND